MGGPSRLFGIVSGILQGPRPNDTQRLPLAALGRDKPESSREQLIRTELKSFDVNVDISAIETC